ncbi:hypothetical protein DPMN_068428 [Dreissena polymorpha]|uniref:Uncharacterized protein n=1 Tax=Dreissena polymorpha TaxID=45954 RepID=A0A9D3YX46_DREPO|nr:hypothetical protein DPMN_068428 [Dreissena polymorpha]
MPKEENRSAETKDLFFGRPANVNCFVLILERNGVCDAVLMRLTVSTYRFDTDGIPMHLVQSVVSSRVAVLAGIEELSLAL